jgi:hypothetical protein
MNAPGPTRCLSDVADVLIGIQVRAGRGARFVQIRHLFERDAGLVSGRDPIEARASAIRAGDVLMSARGVEPAAVVALPWMFGAFPSLDVYLIRPTDESLDARYLAAWLEQPGVRRQLTQDRGRPSKLVRVPKATLESLPIVVPSSQQQRIVSDLHACVRQEATLLMRLIGERRTLRQLQMAQVLQPAEAGQAITHQRGIR